MQKYLYSGNCHDAAEFLEGFFVRRLTVFNTFIGGRKAYSHCSQLASGAEVAVSEEDERRHTWPNAVWHYCVLRHREHRLHLGSATGKGTLRKAFGGRGGFPADYGCTTCSKGLACRHIGRCRDSAFSVSPASREGECCA